MNAKILTNDFITEVGPNQIFVFGSNTAGRHGAGAAKTALTFGAKMGVGIGLEGNTYALPTLDGNLNKLPLSDIQWHINNLEKLIKARPGLHFLITPIGTGLAGFSVEEVAPMFAGFQEYSNVSLPVSFIQIIGEEVIHGFKATHYEDSSYSCRGFIYEIGKSYFTPNILICKRGFHFCRSIIDTLNYYNRHIEITKYLKVIGCGKILTETNKICVSVIKIVEEVEVNNDMFNSGNYNSGNNNSGNNNSGNYNSGYRNSGNNNSGNNNSGYYNSGYRNSGNYNSGDYNSGNYNSGYYNSGYRNSGNYNSGDYNSGNYNSGYYNSGYRNSGNYNSGDYNSGYLNTNTPKLRIFNKETDRERSSLYFPSWMEFDVVKWKYSSDMTDIEKTEHPYHEICGGALITKGYKQAAQESYNAATEEEKRCIEDLPNYDAEILFEIFGIDRRKPI